MPDIPGESDPLSGKVKTGNLLAQSDLLSYEELLRVVRLAVSMGMNKIRLTGGEPLVRKGILEFIEQLSLLDGLEQVRLTTNGVLLAEFAERLYEGGIRHINVSLDTLQPEKFKRITGADFFAKVWQGLQLAQEIGFKIKLNVVAMKGVNDDEFQDFGRLALTQPFQVRFIEFMPVGAQNNGQKDRFIRAEEIKARIAELGVLTPFRREYGEGPARMFNLQSEDNKVGAVGFISPISHHFCDKCNRLRLTSEGKLRACLLNDNETDLKHLLRGNASDADIITSIRETILAKPQGHTLEDDITSTPRQSCCGRMSRIGG